MSFPQGSNKVLVTYLYLLNWCQKRDAKDARTRRPTRPVLSKKQGIHALENAKDTDNQREHYFEQIEICTLRDAWKTEGTQLAYLLRLLASQDA